MTTDQKENHLSKKQTFLAITLTMLTFILGVSEFVIVGLLTEVSSDLGITVATAGTLVSVFAAAYAIGTPILTAYASRFSKYSMMLTLITIFILGNVMSALADSYALLMASRVLTALVSGVLNALALSIANNTMPAVKRSTVIAFIFAGFSIANVIGLPIGTFVGQLGSWHLAFWLTSLLGVIAFVTSMAAIPKNLQGEKSSLKAQLVLLTHSRIILAFLIPVFSVAGTYTIYTYITPIIEEGLSIPARFVSIILLVYGAFSIFSNLLAGKIARQNGMRKLRYAFIIQSVILASLYFMADSTLAGLISLMLMAVMMYVMNATIQLYLMDLAENDSPGTKDFASSLNPVAFNIGIALGSFIGGYVVEIGSLIHLSWVGALVALVASGLTFISYGLDKRDNHATSKNNVQAS